MSEIKVIEQKWSARQKLAFVVFSGLGLWAAVIWGIQAIF